MRWWRRALPQALVPLVQLEPRPLQVFHHPLTELVPGIVGCVLAQQPAEEVTTPGDGEADGEHELGTERPVIHGLLFLFRSVPAGWPVVLGVSSRRRTIFAAPGRVMPC
jgi:hypothetical protein